LIRSIFEWRALALLGFMPQLQTCVRCNEKVDFNAQTYFFSMVDGGIVCSDCQEVGERPIFYNTCYTLIYLLVTPLKQVFRCEVSEALLKTLEKIIQTYVNYHIDLVFSTLDFIKGVENM
jgi:DNA repair protein RecO (recombination protein O)